MLTYKHILSAAFRSVRLVPHSAKFIYYISFNATIPHSNKLNLLS